jgi:hypothetical membrane protein
MKKNKNIIKKVFSVFGVFGPIIFLFIVIILGFIFEGYNHIQDFISELGAIGAPNSIIINYIGFPFLGLSIVFLGISLYYCLNKKNTDIFLIIGFILIIISGIAFFLIGFFPCDKNCINISLIGIIHGYLSNIAQFSLIFSPLCIFNSLKNNYKWKNYDKYFLISFIFSFIFAIIYKSYFFENYTGLLQRISFGIPLVWAVFVSIKIFNMK